MMFQPAQQNGPMNDALSAAALERIVSAWASVIGADRAGIREDDWVFVERADFDSVVVVRIGRYRLAAAPAGTMDIIRDAPRELLLDAEALARILPVGAAPIGTADLLFAEHPPHLRGAGSRETSSTDVITMRDSVSDMEWQESGVAETDRMWTAANPAGQPAAIAGYDIWRSELAQLAVIADPQH